MIKKVSDIKNTIRDSKESRNKAIGIQPSKEVDFSKPGMGVKNRRRRKHCSVWHWVQERKAVKKDVWHVVLLDRKLKLKVKIARQNGSRSSSRSWCESRST